MPVISFMTTKGGAGKTTGSLLLGTILAEQGATVAMLDADPNQPLAKWAQTANMPDRLKIVGGINEDNIQESIESYTAQATFVIIDMEGSANLTAAYAMSDSDAILIPLQPSKLDADEATKTLAFILRQQKTARRQLPVRVVWSRMPAAYTTKTTRELGDQFEQAGIRFLTTRIIEREAFKGIVNFGETLSNLTEEQVPGLEKARENAHAFVSEALELLRENQQ